MLSQWLIEQQWNFTTTSSNFYDVIFCKTCSFATVVQIKVTIHWWKLIKAQRNDQQNPVKTYVFCGHLNDAINNKTFDITFFRNKLYNNVIYTIIGININRKDK